MALSGTQWNCTCGSVNTPLRRPAAASAPDAAIPAVASKEAVGEPYPETNPAFKGDLGRPVSLEGLQVSGARTLAPYATELAHGAAISDN